MNILEYANDVGKTVEEIFKLCDRMEITYKDENTVLDEYDITVLDNELQDEDDYVVSDDDNIAIIEEEILSESQIRLDESEKFEKIKSKVERVETAKSNYQKERKKIYKNRKKLVSNEENNSSNIVVYKDGMTVADLASELGVNSTELIKKLMKLGIMANLNFSLSYEVAELLIVDYGKELKNEEQTDISNFENFEIADSDEDLIVRPPVVTVMGHVDHGKTSLLDAVRETDVVAGEAGGITQAIGAYQVVCNDRKITFIDTPGHEAFTDMRARGAKVTDIVIIIVAADDGIKPQTVEAIDHAKAAGVPIIVAINKIDKPEANVERVMQGLTENGLTPEEWGGDTIICKISAKTKEGIPALLENILLIADMAELKANPHRYASGSVIESKLDKHIGAKASILVQSGTLRLGDPIVVGNAYGKVRTLKNDKGASIVEANPSMPVEITGLNQVPEAGDLFMAFETEKQARNIAEQRSLRSRQKDTNRTGMTLEDLFGSIKEGVKEINVVIKADVNGSLEAIKQSLAKIDVDTVKVKVIRGGVGTVTESDIVLASASNAIVIGFNVKLTQSTLDFARDNGVEIKLYDIIYKMIEDIERSMKGLLEPQYEEKKTGQAEIRQIFTFSKVGNIAGCHVIDGNIKTSHKAKVIRDGEEIFKGDIKSIQREKDQVKEVGKGMDCGITLKDFNDIKEGDIIEAFELKRVEI